MKIIESAILLGVIYYFYDSLPLIALAPLALLALREIVFDFNFEICRIAPTAVVPDRDLPAKDEKKKICVVTGASGFVGSFLVELLLKEGRYDVIRAVDLRKPNFLNPKVECIQGDITKSDQVNQFCENVDTVFHVAGLVTLRDTHHRMKKLEEVNVKGVQNIVNGCVKKGVKNLIHLSSASALFDGTNSPLNEKTPPTVPFHGYGFSKLEGEKRVLNANTISGLKTVALRPCFIYGERSMVIETLYKYQNLDSYVPVYCSHIYGGHVAEWMRLADIKLNEIRLTQTDDISGKFYYIGEPFFNSASNMTKSIKQALNVPWATIYFSHRSMKALTYLVTFIDWYTCGTLGGDLMELNRNYYAHAFHNYLIEDKEGRKIFGFKEIITPQQIIENITKHYGKFEKK